MMKAECPHCHKEIELLGTKEIGEVFHLTDNQIQHARDIGQMPEPWLMLENRFLYERGALEHVIAERSRVRVKGAVQEIMAAIGHLPPEEQAEARKVLESELRGRKKRP